MPLSKARNKERMRQLRSVQPDELAGSLCLVRSKEEFVQPRYMRTPIASAHMVQHLPNCLDGRYR